jgi:hypothetical protein
MGDLSARGEYQSGRLGAALQKGIVGYASNFWSAVPHHRFGIHLTLLKTYLGPSLILLRRALHNSPTDREQ